jgi:hypothetical protein
MTCREWLRENGYEDLVELIDQALASIEAKGRKSRRNWWDTLAGGPNGRSSVREGVKFPVLRVAQIHQGRPVTPNAICRNESEQPPGVRRTGRWSKKRLPSRAKRLARIAGSKQLPSRTRAS